MGKATLSLHRFSYQAEKKRWAELIYYSAKKASHKGILYNKAMVQITYHFKDRRRRDPDNYSGKLLLDGLVGAGVITDDSFTHIELVLKGIFNSRFPHTDIKIVEL